jgi:hypothetical protein
MNLRRQGLGKLVVSATIEACLKRGYREIGWQCLTSNLGSQAVARRVGFEKERDYQAYNSWIPAESAGDLLKEDYEDWALHYERHSQEEVMWAFLAAQAWALAGSSQRALDNLRIVQQAGWKARPEWIQNNWRLDSLRGNPEFQALVSLLIE